MALTEQINQIESALRVLLVPAAPGEYDLHALIRAALDSAGIGYQHEARVCAGARVDFLIGGVAIEVKKSKPARAALHRQLARYLAADEIEAAIVVSQKSISLPERICGKPVSLIALDRLWGVSLP